MAILSLALMAACKNTASCGVTVPNRINESMSLATGRKRRMVATGASMLATMGGMATKRREPSGSRASWWGFLALRVCPRPDSILRLRKLRSASAERKRSPAFSFWPPA